MAVFEYKAQRSDGAMAEGVLEGASRQEALRQLTRDGLRPLRLTESSRRKAVTPSGIASSDGPRRKVSHEALDNFTRQLASLLAAGVPLSRALQILSREGASPAAAARWRSIHDLVVDGNALADAMTQHPDVFPRVYIAMVRAGETGGFLELVLRQISDFQVRERDLKSKVLSALIYPAVLLFLAIAVLIFLLTFFIPRFEPIFQGFDAALPWLTQAIIAASDMILQYGFFLAVGFALAVYALRQWLLSDEGERQWQRWLLVMPVVGPLASRLSMTRFCRMLGTLMGSGVTLMTALRVARESLGNRTLVDAVSSSIERVQKGEMLARSLADCPQLFAPSVIEMIAVAEESGRLHEELVRIAEVTESELDIKLRRAVALSEPLLLFLMAAFIGTIFVGMVLPIFSIQDYIN